MRSVGVRVCWVGLPCGVVSTPRFGFSSRYRDVKLLGKFSAEDDGEEMGMIVEIQVIEKTFLEARGTALS